MKGKLQEEGNMTAGSWLRLFGLRLWSERKGQDLIEYALLGAFLTVAVAGFFPRDIAPSISTVMSKVTSVLDAQQGG
jgi:Flp pilus assembly pilin Flp